MNGGARKGAGRKKGIGISYDIQKHCQKFIEELLKNEAIKSKAIDQLQLKLLDENEDDSLYIIKSGDLYKIGYSSSFSKRIKNYKVHNPDLKILLVIKTSDAFDLEQTLHTKYKDKRIKGEWFNLDVDDITEITSILYNVIYGW